MAIFGNFWNVFGYHRKLPRPYDHAPAYFFKVSELHSFFLNLAENSILNNIKICVSFTIFVIFCIWREVTGRWVVVCDQLVVCDQCKSTGIYLETWFWVSNIFEHQASNGAIFYLFSELVAQKLKNFTWDTLLCQHFQFENKNIKRD